MSRTLIAHSAPHPPAGAPGAPDGPVVQVLTERRLDPAIRAEWDALRRAGRVTSTNSDPIRYLATLEALGASVEPYLAVFRRDGRCIAILVGRSSAGRTRHRVGYWSIPGPRLRLLEVVYDGVLTDGSHRAIQDVVDHLARLRAARRFDAIHFNHLALGAELENGLRSLGAVQTAGDKHWVVDVTPGSFEGSLAHHSGDFRKKLRRYERKAAEHFGGRLALRAFTEPSRVGEFIGIMDRIASQSYKSRLPVANAGAPVWSTLLAAEAAAGRMRCYVLEGGGEPIAYQVGSIHGATYQCEGRGYDSRFRDLSPGTVLFTMTLRDLCTTGIERMDFGFGDAEHKGHFGTRSWEEASLRLHGLGWRSAADAGLARAVALARRLGRSALGGAGLLRYVKQRARRRLLSRSPGPDERA